MGLLFIPTSGHTGRRLGGKAFVKDWWINFGVIIKCFQIIELKQRSMLFQYIISSHKSLSHIKYATVSFSYFSVLWIDKPENTHLHRRGKYHGTADLLRFGQTSKYVYSLNSIKQLYPNHTLSLIHTPFPPNRLVSLQWQNILFVDMSRL